MSKRRKSLAQPLVLAPWWASIGIGFFFYALALNAPKFRVIHDASHPFAQVTDRFLQVISASAYYVWFLFLPLAAMSAIRTWQRRKLLNQQSDLESIRSLSWQDFERLVAEAYHRQGYAVEEVGGGGADDGIDLRLREDHATYVVQCKRWKTQQVGVAPVRELFGVMHSEKADGAFFICSGTYTQEAIAFAEKNHIILVDGGELLKLVQSVKIPEPEAHITHDTTARLEPVMAYKPAESLWAAVSSVSTPKVESALSPACPACGGGMVLRTAKRGSNAGGQFWGCMDFPQCRGTVDIDATT